MDNKPRVQTFPENLVHYPLKFYRNANQLSQLPNRFLSPNSNIHLRQNFHFPQQQFALGEHCNNDRLTNKFLNSVRNCYYVRNNFPQENPGFQQNLNINPNQNRMNFSWCRQNIANQNPQLRPRVILPNCPRPPIPPIIPLYHPPSAPVQNQTIKSRSVSSMTSQNRLSHNRFQDHCYLRKPTSGFQQRRSRSQKVRSKTFSRANRSSQSSQQYSNSKDERPLFEDVESVVSNTSIDCVISGNSYSKGSLSPKCFDNVNDMFNSERCLPYSTDKDRPQNFIHENIPGTGPQPLLSPNTVRNLRARLRSPLDKYQKHLKLSAVENRIELSDMNIKLEKLKKSRRLTSSIEKKENWSFDSSATLSCPSTGKKESCWSSKKIMSKDALKENKLKYATRWCKSAVKKPSKYLSSSCSYHVVTPSEAQILNKEKRCISENNLLCLKEKLHKFEKAKIESKYLAPLWLSPIQSGKDLSKLSTSTITNRQLHINSSLTSYGRSRPMVKSRKCNRNLFDSDSNLGSNFISSTPKCAEKTWVRPISSGKSKYSLRHNTSAVDLDCRRMDEITGNHKNENSKVKNQLQSCIVSVSGDSEYQDPKVIQEDADGTVCYSFRSLDFNDSDVLMMTVSRASSEDEPEQNSEETPQDCIGTSDHEGGFAGSADDREDDKVLKSEDESCCSSNLSQYTNIHDEFKKITEKAIQEAKASKAKKKKTGYTPVKSKWHLRSNTCPLFSPQKKSLAQKDQFKVKRSRTVSAPAKESLVAPCKIVIEDFEQVKQRSMLIVKETASVHKNSSSISKEDPENERQSSFESKPIRTKSPNQRNLESNTFSKFPQISKRYKSSESTDSSVVQPDSKKRHTEIRRYSESTDSSSTTKTFQTRQSRYSYGSYFDSASSKMVKVHFPINKAQVRQKTGGVKLSNSKYMTEGQKQSLYPSQSRSSASKSSSCKSDHKRSKILPFTSKKLKDYPLHSHDSPFKPDQIDSKDHLPSVKLKSPPPNLICTSVVIERHNSRRSDSAGRNTLRRCTQSNTMGTFSTLELGGSPAQNLRNSHHNAQSLKSNMSRFSQPNSAESRREYTSNLEKLAVAALRKIRRHRSQREIQSKKLSSEEDNVSCFSASSSESSSLVNITEDNPVLPQTENCSSNDNIAASCIQSSNNSLVSSQADFNEQEKNVDKSKASKSVPAEETRDKNRPRVLSTTTPRYNISSDLKIFKNKFSKTSPKGKQKDVIRQDVDLTSEDINETTIFDNAMTPNDKMVSTSRKPVFQEKFSIKDIYDDLDSASPVMSSTAKTSEPAGSTLTKMSGHDRRKHAVKGGTHPAAEKISSNETDLAEFSCDSGELEVFASREDLDSIEKDHRGATHEHVQHVIEIDETTSAASCIESDIYAPRKVLVNRRKHHGKLTKYIGACKADKTSAVISTEDNEGSDDCSSVKGTKTRYHNIKEKSHPSTESESASSSVKSSETHLKSDASKKVLDLIKEQQDEISKASPKSIPKRTSVSQSHVSGLSSSSPVFSREETRIPETKKRCFQDQARGDNPSDSASDIMSANSKIQQTPTKTDQNRRTRKRISNKTLTPSGIKRACVSSRKLPQSSTKSSRMRTRLSSGIQLRKKFPGNESGSDSPVRKVTRFSPSVIKTLKPQQTKICASPRKKMKCSHIQHERMKTSSERIDQRRSKSQFTSRRLLKNGIAVEQSLGKSKDTRSQKKEQQVSIAKHKQTNTQGTVEENRRRTLNSSKKNALSTEASKAAETNTDKCEVPSKRKCVERGIQPKASLEKNSCKVKGRKRSGRKPRIKALEPYSDDDQILNFETEHPENELNLDSDLMDEAGSTVSENQSKHKNPQDNSSKQIPCANSQKSNKRKRDPKAGKQQQSDGDTQQIKASAQKAECGKPRIVIVAGKTNRCPYCFAEFPNKNEDLKAHMATHHPHKCDVCYSVFSNRNEAKNHRLTHYDKLYHCKLCQRDFRFHPTVVKRHEESNHHQQLVRVQKQVLDLILTRYIHTSGPEGESTIPDFSQFADMIYPSVMKKNGALTDCDNTSPENPQTTSIRRFYFENPEVQDLLSRLEQSLKDTSTKKSTEIVLPESSGSAYVPDQSSKVASVPPMIPSTSTQQTDLESPVNQTNEKQPTTSDVVACESNPIPSLLCPGYGVTLSNAVQSCDYEFTDLNTSQSQRLKTYMQSESFDFLDFSFNDLVPRNSESQKEKMVSDQINKHGNANEIPDDFLEFWPECEYNNLECFYDNIPTFGLLSNPTAVPVQTSVEPNNQNLTLQNQPQRSFTEISNSEVVSIVDISHAKVKGGTKMPLAEKLSQGVNYGANLSNLVYPTQTCHTPIMTPSSKKSRNLSATITSADVTPISLRVGKPKGLFSSTANRFVGNSVLDNSFGSSAASMCKSSPSLNFPRSEQQLKPQPNIPQASTSLQADLQTESQDPIHKTACTMLQGPSVNLPDLSHCINQKESSSLQNDVPTASHQQTVLRNLVETPDYGNPSQEASPLSPRMNLNQETQLDNGTKHRTDLGLVDHLPYEASLMSPGSESLSNNEGAQKFFIGNQGTKSMPQTLGSNNLDLLDKHVKTHDLAMNMDISQSHNRRESYQQVADILISFSKPEDAADVMKSISDDHEAEDCLGETNLSSSEKQTQNLNGGEVHNETLNNNLADLEEPDFSLTSLLDNFLPETPLSAKKHLSKCLDNVSEFHLDLCEQGHVQKNVISKDVCQQIENTETSVFIQKLGLVEKGKDKQFRRINTKVEEMSCVRTEKCNVSLTTFKNHNSPVTQEKSVNSMSSTLSKNQNEYMMDVNLNKIQNSENSSQIQDINSHHTQNSKEVVLPIASLSEQNNSVQARKTYNSFGNKSMQVIEPEILFLDIFQSPCARLRNSFYDKYMSASEESLDKVCEDDIVEKSDNTL